MSSRRTSWVSLQMYLSRIFTGHRSPASCTEYNGATLLLTWSFPKLPLQFFESSRSRRNGSPIFSFGKFLGNVALGFYDDKKLFPF